MNISKIFTNWLNRQLERAARLRNSAAWPWLRPPFRMFNRFVNVEKVLSSSVTRVKVLTNHRLRLYNLGFTEKTLAELQALIDDQILQISAAWELALWHASQYTPEHARQCLTYLETALFRETDPKRLCQGAVLQAECYVLQGNVDQGWQVIQAALAQAPQADLFLAAANLETSLDAKIHWINQALALFSLKPIAFQSETRQPFLDRLGGLLPEAPFTPCARPEAHVTVIMPAHNAAATIGTALAALQAQTWSDLEILVVDDASSDQTAMVVAQVARQDPRIRLIRASRNQGPYVARNLALQEARGVFVTCHDADDWSHPQKIELQVTHLLNTPTAVANTSQLSRADEHLTFFRRGNPGHYIQINMSSLMFRRQPVLEKAGYWDSVRFGADGEFVRRLKKIFGDAAVVALPTGPLAFLRQSSDSLTGNPFFGYPGYFRGARREYLESHEHFHATAPHLYMDFPLLQRPFPVPEPLQPERPEQKGRRHFDVIIVSDFRLPGGTTASNLEEIKAHIRLGLRTGLVQMSRYDLDPRRKMHSAIRNLLDGQKVQTIVFGEKVHCDILILRHPLILQDRQCYVPDIRTSNLRVIVNQTPLKHYGFGGRFYYDLETCVQNVKAYFGQTGIWHPIGPLVRSALQTHHAADLKFIELAPSDWHNIIDVAAWKRSVRPAARDNIVIGRHARDDFVKWPATRKDILQIYPNSDGIEVRIMGGAQAPQQVLGELPSNWRVYEFGAMAPQDFLAQLDVFVYYTHPDWVESFGRVIFEAMAAGVPVILPPVYHPLFQEAAIYAEPFEVQSTIQRLMADKDFYERQVQAAWNYVEHNFGYARHAARLGLRSEEGHIYSGNPDQNPSVYSGRQLVR